MRRIKRRIFSGSVCEQEVYYIADYQEVRSSKPRPRFRSDDERKAHKLNISRRRFARLVNANFGPTSYYVTLTMDDAHEVHTFDDAKRMMCNYYRRLQRENPDVKIVSVTGRGKGTKRIHFHMIIDGLPEEVISAKWTAGEVRTISHLRENNSYNGQAVGRDYSGLAQYMHDHWTEEQGESSHRYKYTKNLVQPEFESPREVKREYTTERPPRPPKGYKLLYAESNSFGYAYFKYVLEKPKRQCRC